MTICNNFLNGRIWVGILGTFFYLPLSFAFSTFDSSAFSKAYHFKLEQRARGLNQRVYMFWDLQSYGESYSSPMDKASLFSLKGRGKLNYKILDRISLKAQANILFQGGQAQTRFGQLLPSGPAYLSLWLC